LFILVLEYHKINDLSIGILQFLIKGGITDLLTYKELE